MINKYAVLLRKNVILDSGIKTLKDENLLVNFDALLLDTSTKEDPSRVLLPSTSRVIEIVEELKDVAANTKWINTIEGITELPDSATIQDAYDNDSLIVRDIVDGSLKALAKDVKDVTFEDENGQSITLTTIQASINDGILYDLPTNGKFETAVFTTSGWKIDTSKNFIPSELNRLDGEIVNLKTRATNLETKNTNLEARQADNSNIVVASNVTPIVSKGAISLTNVNQDESDKLATRQDVGLAAYTLNNKIISNSGLISALQGNVVSISGQASDASSRLTALEPRVSSIDGQVQTNHNDLVSVNTQITDIKQDITDLETNLDDVTLDVSGLEIDTQANTASINLINNEVSQIQQKDIAQDGRLDGHDSKNNAQDVKIANLETQLNALSVNPLSKFRAASRKWKGVANGNATTANANTTTIAMSTLLADDGEHFVFGDDDDMSVWLEATAIGLGTFKIPADMVIGTTVPDLLEAVRAATGSTLEILSATLGTNGNLTVTRNAGSAIDFTSIKLTRVKQDVMALDIAASSTDLADVGAKVALAQTKANQAYDKAVVVETSLADKQNKAISLAGITATTVETALTEIAGKTTANKGLIDGLTATVAGKQNSLSVAQLAVVNGVAVTTADKTKYDGYAATITGKQDKNLSSAVTGFTATTVEGALSELKTQANTNATNLTTETTNRTTAITTAISTAATDATTKANAAQAAAIADAAAKDTTLHTTITTETDTKLALKQDKITTSTITIPEQVFYIPNKDYTKIAENLTLHSVQNLTYNDTTDLNDFFVIVEQSGNSGFQKISFILGKDIRTQLKNGNTGTDRDDALADIRVYFENNIPKMQITELDNNGKVSIYQRKATQKTIPAQTFKVIA